MSYRRLLAFVLATMASACTHYDVTVNDRVVYTPRPLFADFAAADPALQKCLQKAVDAYKVTSAGELRELDCGDENIADLGGIQVFTGLRKLRLSGNRIASLAPLAPLSSLEALYLADNQVKDPVPLFDLLSLRILDLSGNPGLQCPRRQDLLRVVDLTLPEHCAR